MIHSKVRVIVALQLAVCSPFIRVDYAARPDVLRSNVCASLCCTYTRKLSPVNLSVPPNTQCPSTYRPRLYLRRPNLLSSISSSIPGPSILTGSSTKYWAQTSWMKLYRLSCTLVLLYNYSHLMNRSLNFVDPVTGAHTQCVGRECGVLVSRCYEKRKQCTLHCSRLTYRSLCGDENLTASVTTPSIIY